MGIEENPEHHKAASITREKLAEAAGEEIASQFESRYFEYLDQGASKIEAGHIASGELLAERAEEIAEHIGNGFRAVDSVRHDTEQWREQAGVSLPDES
jgi:hypothetical protein